MSKNTSSHPGKWETLLAELGGEFDATIQLAKVIGKRWSYVAGKTGCDAGLLGMFREELGHGYGAIIFPHGAHLPPAAREEIRRRMQVFLAEGGLYHES